eukprot:COSAG02_NODE_162_length_32474_cov_13.222511_3_plen_467_part_00
MWSAGATAAAAANARAVASAKASVYDYCGANVQDILAEKVGDDGERMLLVSWLGRCVPNRWVTRSFLEDDFVSRGHLAAYDEDRQFEVEAEAERSATATAAWQEDEEDQMISVVDGDLLDDLSITSSTGAAVDRVMTAFEAGDVQYSDSIHAQDMTDAAGSDQDELRVDASDSLLSSSPCSPSVDSSVDNTDIAHDRRERASRRRRGRSKTTANSSRRRTGSKHHEATAVRGEINVEDLPLDCRPYWRAFHVGYIRGALPFDRVARQLAGPSGRGKGVDGSSFVTAGGVARMLCRLGMIGSHSTALSTDSKVVHPPTPWRALKSSQRAFAMAEATELLYEVAELGRCEESLNGKEEERVVRLSALSLAFLYYRTINDRTQLEPRRLFAVVEFLLFAYPGQSVSHTPLVMATNAFQLLTSRYGGQISSIPSRMYEHVEKRERQNGSYSFLQWLNSPLPLLPPQWTVL